MSTFSGKLNEIEHISIDRFDGINLKSKVFFLSHCHTDHMVGLSDLADGLPGPLYLSNISSVIIRRQFSSIRDIKCLDTGVTTLVEYETKGEGNMKKLYVTALPAGHCPGSVMFLFEQDKLKILYTGDFRLNLNAIQSIQLLKKFANEAGYLDAAYIDSTFLSLKYPRFPKQQQSVDITLDLIERWLSQHAENVVVIRPPALYGYEFLFVQIVKKFKTKIHMSQTTINDYQFIPELDNCFDRSSVNCLRIHLCSSTECTPTQYKWNSKSLMCSPQINAKRICIIRPTAVKWNGLAIGAQISMPHTTIPEVHFICYSNHSSYEEIRDLLTYLQPKTVNLNVIPRSLDAKTDMEVCLKGILEKYQQCDIARCKDQHTDVEKQITFDNILAKMNSQTLCELPKEQGTLQFEPLVKRKRR